MTHRAARKVLLEAEVTSWNSSLVLASRYVPFISYLVFVFLVKSAIWLSRLRTVHYKFIFVLQANKSCNKMKDAIMRTVLKSNYAHKYRN